MKISTRVRYATRLMLDLALHTGRGPVLLKDVARRQEVSEKYLSQIIIPLKAKGLVRSYRGAHGGYELNGNPSEVNLHDIYVALEGDVKLVACAADPSVCTRAPQCVTIDVWAKVGNAIDSTLASITLQDLVRESEARGTSGASYSI